MTMKQQFIRNLIIVLVIGLWLCSMTYANNIEGTNTYKDYLFVLVHGLNSERGIFEGQKQYGNLRSYLENELGLKGRVYCYNFSNNRGDNFALAKEIGDRSYHNPNPEMDGKSWLEKARIDFEKDNPGKPIPSQYILITHSMGNYAARAYIYSDQLYKEGGFYKDDVAKVVFITPPLLGSDAALLAYIKALEEGKGLYEKAGATWEEIKKIPQRIQEAKSIDLKKSIEEIFKVNLKFDLSQVIYDAAINGNSNPYYPYFTALDIAASSLYTPREYATLYDEFKGMIFEGRQFYYTSQALFDLLPYSNAVMKLKNVEPLEPDREPAYSIVYAKGIPAYDFVSTFPTMGMKWINDITAQDMFAEEAARRGSDYFDPSGRIYETVINQALSLDYQKLSIFHPGFWKIDGSEGFRCDNSTPAPDWTGRYIFNVIAPPLPGNYKISFDILYPKNFLGEINYEIKVLSSDHLFVDSTSKTIKTELPIKYKSMTIVKEKGIKFYDIFQAAFGYFLFMAAFAWILNSGK